MIIERFNSLLRAFSFYKDYSKITIKSVSDIKNIPITTKHDLQDFDISKCPHKPVMVASTSGTTSKVTLIGHSEESEDKLLERYRYIAYELVMLKENDVTCNLLEVFEPFIRPLGLSTLISPNSNISIEDIEQICQRIFQSKARCLLTSGHLLKPILDGLEKRNYPLQSVIYTGVKVTEEFNRFVASRCKYPYEIYACNELPGIAIRKAGQEQFTVLLPEEMYLEVLDPKGNAKNTGEGVLLLTDFNNYSFPIIRFYTGDIVRLDRFGLRILGRIGSYLKISGDLINKTELLAEFERVIGHNDFIIKVHSDIGLKDYLIVELLASDLGKKDTLRAMLVSSYGIKSKYKLLEQKIPQTRTNKKINIIDMRNEQA